MRFALVCLLILIAGATEAHAVDIAGKWGIGAGFFSRNESEYSLIRGRSERSAWAIDFYMNAEVEDLDEVPQGAPSIAQRRDQVRWIVGPRYRLYARREAGLTPHVDFFAQGVYGRASGGGFTSRSAGARAGLGFGLEFFTPWSFSAGAYSDVLSGEWSSVRYESSTSFPTGLPIVSEGHRATLRAGLLPGLIVRGYF